MSYRNPKTIPEEHTLDAFSVPWNTELSETDKRYAALFYPPAAHCTPAARCEWCFEEMWPSQLYRHLENCPHNPWTYIRRGQFVP